MAAVQGQVSKDELLKALSKGVDIQDDPPAMRGSSSAEEDDEESFHEFLNAPDTEDEEEDVMAKIFSGTGMDPDRGVEEKGKNNAGLYGGPDTVRQHGDILATYRSTGQMEISLVEQRKAKKLEALRRDLAVKAKLAEDARSAFLDEEQQLRSFKKQAAQGKLLDPARLSYQEGELKKALDHLTECEKAQDLADLELHHILEEGAKSERICHEEAAHHRAIAAERHDGEAKRADRLLTREEQERQAVLEAKALAEEEAERQAREGRRHQAAGIQRLKGTLAIQKQRREELEEVRELRFQHDAQRLLTLKNSVDAVGRQVQSTNEARRKQQERVKAEREERKQRLLDDGRNPYEIWRREEMEAKKEREKQHLAALNEMRSGKLLAQITAEEKRYKKNRKIENQKRKEAEDFQKEVGNYAKEKKVSAYIRKMTIGNVDVLDPTGTALRIDPSKITVQKTHAFGLGRAPPAEIDKVDRDLSRTSKLLQRKQPRPDSVESMQELGPSLDLGATSSPQDGNITAGPSASNVSESEATGKLWTPKLTKLEEQYLAAAKERQKQTIATVQRCWGKEFKGEAFLAKPSVIAFDDFEVGKQYRQVVEVTNVSLTFNQFKLLPLDDKYQEFFEIEFQPPGRMSAGVTRYITIWFLPKVPENIVTTFPILAKTGRIDFPLRCTTKKTILAITPTDFDNNPEVDFGQVLSGEVGTQQLQIKNDGALSAKFECEAVESDSEFLSMISWSPTKGEFKAHGTTKISFQFKPTVVGSFSTTLRLHCGNGAAGDAKFEKSYEVVVRGTCVDVPIYVEKEEYDLKTCIFGHIFRENIVVHNRRSVPMKITVEKPKHIEGQLQINPTLAYVQGNKEQVIQVKFSPKDDFLDRHQQYRDASRKGVTGAFRIPVTILGAEQVLPVHTVLVGTLTTNNISFQPSVLNFGRVFVGSTASARMLMVNESLLPQRYVFTRLPAFLTVMKVPSDVIEEEDGDRTGVQSAVLDGGLDGAFGTLLPGERRQVSVAYTPQSATEMNVRMQLKAITGQLSAREFAVNCQGQGIAPLVELSNTTVQLAAIPSGSASKESVVIRNCAKIPYTMNLVLPSPALAGLKASPVCTTLAPGQSQRIQLEFWPTQDYVNLLAPKPPEQDQESPAEEDEEAAANAAAAAKEQHVQEVSREIRRHGGRRWENEATRSIHANWKLACFLKPEGKAATKGNETGATKKENQIVYMSVSTCVLPPILTATPAILDFGEVTAQQRKLLPLTFVAEAGVEPQQLRLDALPQNACFTVLSAARAVSNKPFQLMVEFHPQQVQIYQTSLLVRTQSTQFQVPLLGRGVRPVLKIEPEDGILRLGAVTFGADGKDNTQEKLTIKNDSPFELRFSLETIAGADPNHTGPSPFSMSPSIGVVEAHGSKVVTVTFRPHRPLTVFREKVLVNVPNQKEPTFVYLYGHCFKHQIYALPDLPFSPFLVSTASRPPALSDSMAVGIGSGANVETGDFEYPQAQQLDFSLKFGEGERSQCLLIGACVPPGFPTAPQNTPATAFEFQIIQSDYSKYFTLEAPEGGKPDKAGKGQVVPGKPPIKVAFKYTPEENTKLTYGDVSLDLLRGIGQWITCQVRGVLSGGFVPPGASPTQELNIELRAYLQQI